MQESEEDTMRVKIVVGDFYNNGTLCHTRPHTEKWKRDFTRLAKDFEIATKEIELIICEVDKFSKPYESNAQLYERARRKMMKIFIVTA